MSASLRLLYVGITAWKPSVIFAAGERIDSVMYPQSATTVEPSVRGTGLPKRLFHVGPTPLAPLEVWQLVQAKLIATFSPWGTQAGGTSVGSPAGVAAVAARATDPQ